MAIFRVDLLVESASNDTRRIQKDISSALAPLGFYPYVKTVEKVKD